VLVIFILLLVLQFVLSCLFMTGLLIPAARLLGQARLTFRSSLQCGIGFAMFQLTSVLLFAVSIYFIRDTIFAPDTMRLALVWVSLPLLLIVPILISFSTGWRRSAAIVSGTMLTLGWAGLQYGLGMLLLSMA
jgi:hypothetical protein